MAAMPWQWRSLVLLTAIYASAGLILGAAAGLLLAAAKKDSNAGGYQIAAALTIVMAYGTNAVARGLHNFPEFLSLGIAVVLIVALFGALLSNFWRLRVTFFSNPLTLALLMLGIPWISTLSGSPRVWASLWIAWATFLASLLFRARLPRNGKPTGIRPQLATAGVILVIFCAGIVSGRSTSAMPRNANIASAESPNIVLITMDTVRADHLSIFGYGQETTPNLQQFGGISTVYSNAIAASDFTLPGHASIFTGLYPSQHGAEADPTLKPFPFRPLPENSVTLADVLARRGYATSAIVANYGFLFPGYGLMKGFQTVDWTTPAYLKPVGLGTMAVAIAGRITRPDLSAPVPRRASDINRSAFAWLEKRRNTAQPFFLFLNYMDAHAPYAPIPPFNTKFRGFDADPARRPVDRQEINDGASKLEPAAQRYLISQYDGAIATEDAAIAELFGRLRSLGLYDNTMIIVTADHGEALGERSVLDHGLGTVYQDVVHIPLLIKYPRQEIAARSDALVSQVDLLPTVLDIAGIDAPAELQGRSLRAAGGDADKVFVEARAGAWNVLNTKIRGDRRAVLKGSMKYIEWTNGPPELFDLAIDPREKHNLYQPGTPQAEAMAQILQTWSEAMPRRNSAPKKLDEGAIERLKSLGYVQ